MNNGLKEKLGTKGLATLGLIFITFLAAIPLQIGVLKEMDAAPRD